MCHFNELISVRISCGGQSSENCTHFESSSATTTGHCGATICPCNRNICQVWMYMYVPFNCSLTVPICGIQNCSYIQLRLDFVTFSIAGPSTNTNSEFKILNGSPVEQGFTMGYPVSSATQCLTDTFSVTHTGGANSDLLCGVNTGQHCECSSHFSIINLFNIEFLLISVYIEANDGCVQLNFILGLALVSRTWDIKVFVQYRYT